MQSKVLLLTVSTPGLNTLEDAKMINDFMYETIVYNAYNVCDGFNIAQEGVTVNYKSIRYNLDNVPDTVHDIGKYGDIIDLAKPAKDFVEAGLLDSRRGHVDVTGGVIINFNVVFLSTGTVIITQEVFSS